MLFRLWLALSGLWAAFILAIVAMHPGPTPASTAILAAFGPGALLYVLGRIGRWVVGSTAGGTPALEVVPKRVRPPVLVSPALFLRLSRRR
jgi:hypothetical protein